MEKKDIILSLREFKDRSQKKYNIIRIGIFGSAARNDMTDQSDIDVVVEMETPDAFNLIGIKQDLEDEFQRPIDIIRYREKMNEFLKRRIDKEAVYV